jgi:hypothetical protein
MAKPETDNATPERPQSPWPPFWAICDNGGAETAA